MTFKWDGEKGMHLSCDAAAAPHKNGSESPEDKLLRLRCLGQEVFDVPRKYTEALEQIKSRMHVQQRQAETYFTEMNKAHVIQKDLLNFWKISL